MRTFVVTIAAILVGVSAFAGVTQNAFRTLVSGATGVEIRHREKLLFSTAQTKEVAEVVAAFELIDPIIEKTKDGEEIVLPVCFCIPGYTITFTGLQGGAKAFGLKDDNTKVLPPEPLGLSSIADIHISKRSIKSLKRLIGRWENSPKAATRPSAP